MSFSMGGPTSYWFLLFLVTTGVHSRDEMVEEHVFEGVKELAMLQRSSDE